MVGNLICVCIVRRLRVLREESVECGRVQPGGGRIRNRSVCEQLILRRGEVLESRYYIARKCAAKLEILTKEMLQIQAC